MTKRQMTKWQADDNNNNNNNNNNTVWGLGYQWDSQVTINLHITTFSHL
jgi:hypothetical protein